jgi:hypothetical protein
MRSMNPIRPSIRRLWLLSALPLLVGLALAPAAHSLQEQAPKRQRKAAPVADDPRAGLPIQAGRDAPLDKWMVPPWSRGRINRFRQHNGDARQSPEQRGAALVAAMGRLQPGDHLKISAGTYSIDTIFNLTLQGTPSNPIWITARPGDRVILTRPDARQNVINVGTKKVPARFIVFQGLEITGGSQGLRIFRADHLWIDNCYIHDVGGVGIAANSGNTAHLTITRNEITATADTGEGMYLGANWGVHKMSRSLIARNWVHHTGGYQGDGIEIKQGSFGNRVVENIIHNTPYPAILVYGTDGEERNIIERNILWGSSDNVLQVQGEAIVRNNLLMQGNIGFHTHDHQGDSRDLEFVHNTIINAGDATSLFSWGGREGMVFANNAIYSATGVSINFPEDGGGHEGVRVEGNVIFGEVVGIESGFVQGNRGLTDFRDLTWQGGARDARPNPDGALVGAGVTGLAVTDDLAGNKRTGPPTAGCLQK